MYLNDRSGMPNHLLGDPTLTLRPLPVDHIPELALSGEHLDFEDVALGTESSIPIEFKNAGEEPATVNFIKGCYSLDGKMVLLGYRDVFQYRHPDTGETFRSFAIAPGQSKQVPFVFYPRADGPTGLYTMTMRFYTNDPNMPYITIRLEGTAIRQ